MIFAPHFSLLEIQWRMVEARAFENSLKGLSPDLVQRLRGERAARLERERLEAAAERRHRELCEAIRSASFWRLF